MMNRSKRTSIAGKLSIALALFFGVSAFAQVPRSKHVYIVAEENRSYEHIVGSASMPYLNSLLAKGGLATQFYANQHGSLENYLIVTSGQKLTDNNDTLAVFNVDNIERHLLTNGMTFKSYAQSLPYAGYTGLYSGAYMKRHGPLLATAPFQPGGDGVLIIWADEADLSTDNRCSATVSTGCGGHIVVAMIGPQIKPGYKSTTTYHHQSVLRTMLEALGTTSNFPAAANTAPDMREFFKGNTTPTSSTGVVQVSSPTSSTVTGPSVTLAASASGPNPITFMRISVDIVCVVSG